MFSEEGSKVSETPLTQVHSDKELPAQLIQTLTEATNGPHPVQVLLYVPEASLVVKVAHLIDITATEKEEGTEGETVRIIVLGGDMCGGTGRQLPEALDNDTVLKKAPDDFKEFYKRQTAGIRKEMQSLHMLRHIMEITEGGGTMAQVLAGRMPSIDTPIH